MEDTKTASFIKDVFDHIESAVQEAHDREDMIREVALSTALDWAEYNSVHHIEKIIEAATGFAEYLRTGVKK